MISVFTPSHRPDHLDEAVTSVLAQTFTDWELVIALPPDVEWVSKVEDRRIHVYRCPCVAEGVGAAKHFAVDCCQGDIFVELDHDDELHPDALLEINLAFAENPGAALVYSDFAQINEDGTPNLDRFNASAGWTYREFGDYLVCEAMEPTPHNVSYIWFAPNHVRAFPRWAYEKVGGYDPGLEVLDDQHLMMRLYAVGEFVRIPECLYFQRMHANNTQRKAETNAFIQTETVRMYDAGIDGTVRAWAEREGLLAVELGCGPSLTPGYAGLDLVHGATPRGDDEWGVSVEGSILHQMDVGGVVKWDLSEGIPLPDSSVGVIRAVDFLEHLPHSAGIMAEIHRVLAPNGLLLSLTPSTDGRGAWCDPTHVSGWNELSARYYCDERFATLSPQNAEQPKFQVSRLVTYFPSDWHRDNRLDYLCMNLIAVKPGYTRDGGALLWDMEQSPEA